ncbi:MAG: TIGR02757 family protein [Bacteroidales bacterium]|nr:TIGR02757 family protein [Bacteroidales bacterium]
MDFEFIHALLEEKFRLYNNPAFIVSDPVSIPHFFSLKQDIEIAGFLAATISWGNRKTIVSNARRLMRMMDWAPYDFLTHARDQEFQPFLNFVHRTFNGEDCLFFLQSLREIYSSMNSLESLFTDQGMYGAEAAICRFRDIFLNTLHLKRSEKHIANPARGSSAKRLNMFLRWMVRNDNNGVDFGIWKNLDPAKLICPLDVHSARVARKLGLLSRKINDWKAAEELTANLRKFDLKDPVKYDFALFGLGIYEKF